MKVGSIVECIKPPRREIVSLGRVINIKQPVIGERYIIRALPKEDAVLLEEIVNPFLPFKKGNEIIHIEPDFYIDRFKELLPPEEASEVIKEAEKIIKEVEYA